MSIYMYTVFQKTDTLFMFAITLCVVDRSLKYLAILQQRKFATKTYFKFYIDVWCLIVTQAENTSSTATVDINITQQNPTLKLVTKFEMNAKHSQRQPDQVFKLSSTSFHTSSSVKMWSPQRMLGNTVADLVQEFGATQFATMSSCAQRFIKYFNFKFW